MPAVALTFFLALLAACGGSSEDTPAADTDGDPPVAVVQARWATAEASSVQSLMRDRQWAFVGQVTDLAETLDVDLVPGDDGPQATVAGKPVPENTGPPTMPVSIFDVTVEDVLSGDLEPGQSVLVRQTGGRHIQSTGEEIRVILEGDELLVPGVSYLFFVSPSDDGHFVTSPISRMIAEDDATFSAVEHFAELGAMRELASLNRSGVQSLVEETVAQ